jgi:hypothetical protein
MIGHQTVKIHHAILFAALFLATVCLSFGADKVPVYHMGNSPTDSLHKLLMPMSAGPTQDFYSNSIILGAPLR